MVYYFLGLAILLVAPLVAALFESPVAFLFFLPIHAAIMAIGVGVLGLAFSMFAYGVARLVGDTPHELLAVVAGWSMLLILGGLFVVWIADLLMKLRDRARSGNRLPR